MDWVVLALFAVVVTIITLRFGTQYAVAFSLAAPLTIFVYSSLPWLAFVGSYTSQLVIPSLQAAVVGGIMVAMFVLIFRMIPRNLLTGSLPIQAILSLSFRLSCLSHHLSTPSSAPHIIFSGCSPPTPRSPSHANRKALVANKASDNITTRIFLDNK